LAWIRDNLAEFWTTAYTGYCNQGRGAVVIDTTTAPLGEDSQFQYTPQADIEVQADNVARQLAHLVADYDPHRQFIAVFIRPVEGELEFSMFQIRVAEALAEAAKTYRLPVPSPVKTSSEVSRVEPPDLETLMAWEEEGGCEATDGCWTEPDGVCPHGHRSWLLELGLI
jgi:hypothetical protein